MNDKTQQQCCQAEIQNKRGLHARASAKFVKMAETFDANILVTKGCETVGATSIMGLMMLAASKGCSVEICATGNQASEALKSLQALIDDKFGEGE